MQVHICARKTPKQRETQRRGHEGERRGKTEKDRGRAKGNKYYKKTFFEHENASSLKSCWIFYLIFF